MKVEINFDHDIM